MVTEYNENRLTYILLYLSFDSKIPFEASNLLHLPQFSWTIAPHYHPPEQRPPSAAMYYSLKSASLERLFIFLKKGTFRTRALLFGGHC